MSRVLCWPSSKLTEEIARKLKEAGAIERYESNGVFITVQFKQGAKIFFRDFERIVREVVPDIDREKVAELWRTLFSKLSCRRLPRGYVVVSEPVYAKTIAFRVDEETYRRLEEIAREKGVAMSNLMRELIDRYLGEG